MNELGWFVIGVVSTLGLELALLLGWLAREALRGFP